MARLLLIDDMPEHLSLALKSVKLALRSIQFRGLNVLIIPQSQLIPDKDWEEHWRAFDRTVVFPDSPLEEIDTLVRDVKDELGEEPGVAEGPYGDYSSQLLALPSADHLGYYFRSYANSPEGIIWCACSLGHRVPSHLVDVVITDTDLVGAGDVRNTAGMRVIRELKEDRGRRIKCLLYSGRPDLTAVLEGSADLVDQFYIKKVDDPFSEEFQNKVLRLVRSVKGRIWREEVLEKSFRRDGSHPAKQLTHTVSQSQLAWADSQEPGGQVPECVKCWNLASNWWAVAIKGFLDFYNSEMKHVLNQSETSDWDDFVATLEIKRSRLRNIEPGNQEHENVLVSVAVDVRNIYKYMRTYLYAELVRNWPLPREHKIGDIPAAWRGIQKFIYRGREGDLITNSLCAVTEWLGDHDWHWSTGGDEDKNDQWIAIEQQPLQDLPKGGPLGSDSLLQFVEQSHPQFGAAGGCRWLYNLAECFDVFVERVHPENGHELVFLAYYRGPEAASSDQLPDFCSRLEQPRSLRILLRV